MRSRRKTHVYKGRYALVGAEAASSCRMFVRPHVQLPYGDLDHFSLPIPPEQTVTRQRRLDTRLKEMEREQISKGQPNLRAESRKRPAKSVSRKSAWAIVAVALLFFGGLVGKQYGTLTQKATVLTMLQEQIDKKYEANDQLKAEYADASDEVKVRYQAVQQLGMVSPKGAQSVEIMAPVTRTSTTQEVEIPENVGLFASLFAFLN